MLAYLQGLPAGQEVVKVTHESLEKLEGQGLDRSWETKRLVVTLLMMMGWRMLWVGVMGRVAQDVNCTPGRQSQ